MIRTDRNHDSQLAANAEIFSEKFSVQTVFRCVVRRTSEHSIRSIYEHSTGMNITHATCSSPSIVFPVICDDLGSSERKRARQRGYSCGRCEYNRELRPFINHY